MIPRKSIQTGLGEDMSDEVVQDKETGRTLVVKCPKPNTDVVSFVVPIRTHSKLNQRIHWATRAKHAKAERVATWAAARPVVADLIAPCVVVMTRIAPRDLDDDNLRGALKAVRDEVAYMLGVDDRSPLVRWEYGQERGASKFYAVKVTITRRQP